jgi:stress response protein YsnF
MIYEKIVTLYDTADHAEAARRNLVTAGFPPSDISTINSNTLGLTSEKLREPGLWHRLFGREIQQYEAALYGHSVDSGGVILTVRVPEGDVARATTILNAHQAVDVLKRAEQQGLISAAAPKPAPAPPPSTTQTTATQPEATARPATLAATRTVPGEEILALAQEEINVGKRLVQEGTTRIRRFIIETPVEAQVTLHEEHARVIRRAITDPNYIRNIDWTDKTIEITETAEEPVVTKSVHVAEEVVIQREGSDHVKTLRDKVRRQQVEVERLSDTEPVMKK